MSDEGAIIPIKAQVGMEVSKDIKIIDFKNFPPRTNKIEDVGVLKKRKFLVTCDGQGQMTFIELQTINEKVKQLEDLHRKGYLSGEELKVRVLHILDENKM